MEQNRVLIVTGDGKGKTTSAFGMALRALGHGQRAAVVQFIKHDGGYGEVEALRLLPGAEVICSGLGFTPRHEDSPQWERHADAARGGWRCALERMRDEAIRTLVLDEVFYPIKYGHISLEDALDAVREFQQSGGGRVLVMTGRGAPEELVTLADTVSRVECVKHALQSDVKAQENVEF